MKKKGLLGPTVSLVLMLIVLGLTLYLFAKCTTMDQTKKSFDDIIELVKEVNVEETGYSRPLPINLNKESMIWCFNKDQQEIKIFKGEDKGKKTYFLFRRPIECTYATCICHASGLIKDTRHNNVEGATFFEGTEENHITFDFFDVKCKSLGFIDDKKIKTRSMAKGIKEGVAIRNIDGIIIDSAVARTPHALPQYNSLRPIVISKSEDNTIMFNTGAYTEEQALELLR